MEVKDTKDKQILLNKEISKLIQQFEHETDLIVRNIVITRKLGENAKRELSDIVYATTEVIL